MELQCAGPIWFWKGPSPWHFVTVPGDQSADIRAVAAAVSYGWGVIPVAVRIGQTRWTTSLFPQGDRYLVPVKASIRAAESLQLGDVVTVILTVAT